jgi:hypothetical protein
MSIPRYIIVQLPVSLSLIEDSAFDIRALVERECIAAARAEYAGTPYAESEMTIKSFEGPLIPFEDQYPALWKTMRFFIGRIGPAELNLNEDVTVIPRLA